MNTKIILGILAVVIVWLLYNSKEEKQQLAQSVKDLTTLVEKQEVLISSNQAEMIEAAQKQRDLLSKQLLESESQSDLLAKKLKESEQQSQAVQEKMEDLGEVVDDLKLKQLEEKQLSEAHKAMSQESLYASRRVSGLQTATMIKQMIAQYYLEEGKFPHSNKSLRLPKSNSYANQDVHSITVSHGGKITVVYTESSGINNGAISLTPKYKNNQIQWQCTTRDYVTIHQTMPQCKLL